MKSNGLLGLQYSAMESQVLIIDHKEVIRLLPMNECVVVMAETLESLARDEVFQPLRTITWLPDKEGALATMPAYSGRLRAVGMKVIAYFPGNRGTDLDTHQGAVMLFDARNGRLQALVDATEITAIRTAAVSGVATRLLARENVQRLAILGSGTQARTHLQAMLVARPFRQVQVWSRTLENAQSFARREGDRHGIPVQAAPSARAAVSGADVVCTTTSAIEPVLEGEWLEPGMHINAVGSSMPFARELDSAAVVRSELFVDRRESTLKEAGDFLFPKKEGAIGDNHIRGEIGEILTGKLEGRTSKQEITLFKSLGLAVEDVASAHHIYHKALEQGVGHRLSLGGTRREEA